MATNKYRLLALPAVAFGIMLAPGWAQARPGNPEAENAIQKNAEAFVEAFHNGDAKAVAARWTADGDYTDLSGDQHKGRDAIEKLFAGLFAENKSLKVRIEGLALRFISPDVAIEDGTSAVFPADGGPPSRVRFMVVHVRKDGQWLFSSVRDSPYQPPSNFDRLRGLDWIVGDWTGNGASGETERLTVSWNETQNFLNATFSSTINNVSVGHAAHYIGWDPIEKRVRSWIFDASGAFGDGTWTHDGKTWTVKTTSVLQDGKKAAATYVLSAVDANTLTLEAKDRSEDGKPISGSRTIKFVRAK